MIALSKFFNINAEDVEYIEATNSTSGDHPYHLTVHLKSANVLSVSYRDSKSRDSARNELVRLVDQARREDEDIEKILSTVKRIDRRQLRIWRQIKSLLGISMEE